MRGPRARGDDEATRGADGASAPDDGWDQGARTAKFAKRGGIASAGTRPGALALARGTVRNH